MSIFFPENTGDIQINERNEKEQIQKKGIIIVNKDKFGDMKKPLANFRGDLGSSQHNTNKIVCGPENKHDIECEATFSKEVANIGMKNIIARFEDLDAINIYTKKAKREGGKLKV